MFELIKDFLILLCGLFYMAGLIVVMCSKLSDGKKILIGISGLVLFVFLVDLLGYLGV